MPGMIVFVCNPRIQLAVAERLKNLCYIASTRPVRTVQQYPAERGKTGGREHICTTEQQQGPTEDLFPFNSFHTSVEHCIFNAQKLFGLGRA